MFFAMKRITARGRWLAVCAGLMVAASGCSGSDDPPPPAPAPPSELERELHERIDEAVESGFSGAVLITVDGERLLTEGHGFANREDATENAPDTAFDVGSILKSFTATALFRLEEQGALELSDTLDAFFPEAPDDKASITLREILQHRAGFDEYHDTTGDFEPMTRLEARDRILSQELLFSPGTDEAYSNSGYTLLADVIETVSGEPFVEHIHHALFEPAGMVESGFYSEPLWQSVETAMGYEASTFGDNDPAGWPYTWALVGNGGLVTTVLDLNRWISALFGGRVVSAATLSVMQEEFLDPTAAEVGGETVYAEAGAGDFGLGGVLVFAPASDTRILIATNTYETFDIEALALELTLLTLSGEDSNER
jgi:CubicO group peptidase (beta-lactamase class C family)